jgi:hypothetical protein
MGAWRGEIASDTSFNPGSVPFSANVTDTAPTITSPGPFGLEATITGTGLYTFSLSVDVDVDVAGNLPTELTLYDVPDALVQLYDDIAPHAVGTGLSTVTKVWTFDVTVPVYVEVTFPGDDAEGTIFAGSSLTITEPVSAGRWWLGVCGGSG